MVIPIAHLYTQINNNVKTKQTKTRSNTQMPVNCLNIASSKELMLSIKSPNIYNEYIYLLFFERLVWQINYNYVAIKRSMKLEVRMSTGYLIGRKLNIFKHSVTTTGEPVRKCFIKIRVKEKSDEYLQKEHASTP